MRIVALCLLIAIAFGANINLQDNMILALESANLKNLFVGIDAQNCQSVQEGKCGTIFGVNLPISGQSNNISNFLQKYKELEFSLVKQNDFFCLKFPQYNAFLSLEGNDCQNLNSPKQCGNVILHKMKDMKCSNEMGWRITQFQNYYILQSVQYPNVYLYFNAQNCQQQFSNISGASNATNTTRTSNVASSNVSNFANLKRCGNLVGFFIKNLQQDIQSNQQYRWALFNIFPIQGIQQGGSMNSGH
jgi:hypothetical protein